MHSILGQESSDDELTKVEKDLGMDNSRPSAVLGSSTNTLVLTNQKVARPEGFLHNETINSSDNIYEKSVVS